MTEEGVVNYTSIVDLRPEQRDLNVRACVVKSTKINAKYNELVLSDDRGTILCTSKAEHSGVLTPGKTVELLGAKTEIFHNSLRLLAEGEPRESSKPLAGRTPPERLLPMSELVFELVQIPSGASGALAASRAAAAAAVAGAAAAAGAGTAPDPAPAPAPALTPAPTPAPAHAEPAAAHAEVAEEPTAAPVADAPPVQQQHGQPEAPAAAVH